MQSLSIKKKLSAGVITLLSLFMFSACSSSDRAQCGSSTDCAGNEICREGVCESLNEPECVRDTDCATGFVCTNASCVQSNTPAPNNTTGNNPTTNNTTPNPNNNTGPNNNPGNNNNGENNTPIDPANPIVTSVTPADDSKNVDLQPTITVVFSKPMQERTINHHSFFVRDADNQNVPASPPTYDASSRTATLTLTQPLSPATEYRIIVNQNAQDIANTPLFQQYSFVFFTTYEEPALHQNLAEEFAPVLYQALRRPDSTVGVRTDIPTTVDFDGDMNANNNRASSQNASVEVRAHAYYNVIESKSHYFIHYVFYYPTRLETNVLIEHDMIGIVVIVDKDSHEIALVEGIENATSDRLFAFKPTFSVVEGKNETARRNLVSFPATGLENGTNYPLYVTGGNHSACNWYVSGSVFPPQCAHDAGKFPGGDDRGVVMRLGDTADKFEDAELNVGTGFLEMNYKLVPFVDLFWLYRADYSCGLFEVPSQYQPQGNRPSGPGDNRPLWLPKRLCSNDTNTYGIPPYQWARTAGSNDGGQWFLDPAYMMNWRYNFGEDVEFSVDYCYNVFFGIDRVNDPDYPECAQ